MERLDIGLVTVACVVETEEGVVLREATHQDVEVDVIEVGVEAELITAQKNSEKACASPVGNVVI